MTDDGMIRLRAKIRKECRSVYRFAKIVSLTQSMLSKVLNGKRRLMPWHYSNFAKALHMTEEEFKNMIGE